MHDYLCSVSVGLLYILWLLLPVLIFVFSILAKRVAWKSISEMTYFVWSGILNLNSIYCMLPEANPT